MVPVLLLLWHTWQAHVSGRSKNLCFPETNSIRVLLVFYFCFPGPIPFDCPEPNSGYSDFSESSVSVTDYNSHEVMD